MYDLHNHLLPGLDDGSADMETSLQLARIAVEDGITHTVCTPHIHPGRYDNTKEGIYTSLNRFKEALLKEGIPLAVSAAAEVRIGPEIVPAVKNNSLPFIGKWNNSDVLLLEFPSNLIPLGSEKLIEWLLKNSITPMIAHPERNSIFQNDTKRLSSFIQQGCLTQGTASAILGKFGNQAKKTLEYLLQQDAITILATDAHNLDYRPPKLSASFKEVSELTSTTTAKRLFIENPALIAATKF
jgi:protein-tyrosine phosphatase